MRFTIVLFFYFSITALKAQQVCDTSLFKKGNECRLSEKFEDAIETYTQLLQNCPNFTSALIYRGFCYYNLGKADQAISDLDSAVSIAKMKYKVSLFIGNSFFDSENYQLARRYFKIASTSNSQESEPYFKIGRCLWLDRIGLLQKSKVEDYSKDSALLGYLKDTILYYYTKAISIDSAKNYVTYQSPIRDAASDVTTNYEYWYYRAIVYSDFFDYQNALADYEMTLMIHPTIQAYEYAAHIARKLNLKEKACSYIQTWAYLFNPTEKKDIFKKQEYAEKFCKELGIPKK